MSDASAIGRKTKPAPEPIIAPAERADLEAVRALFRDYAGSVDAPSCFDGFERELRELPGDCAPPLGGILLARDAGTGAAIGVVAYRALAPCLAEMKRLYVVPGWRGRSVGRRLVEAALAAAAERGHEAVRLATLPQVMPAADALYRALGFRAIPPYDGAGCGGVCYELAL